MKKVLLIVLLVMMAVSGCTTVKDSYVRSPNETVRIEYAIEKAPTNLTFVIPSWAEAAARQIGAWALQEISKKYVSSWEGYRVIPLVDAQGEIIPTKVYVERVIDNVVVESICFRFAPVFNNSLKKYFTVEEGKMLIGQTKSKVTPFLSSIIHADEMEMRIRLEMYAPSATLQGGISTYTWDLPCEGVTPHWTNSTHRLSIWEVPSSEAHFGIHVTVVEENKIAGWLLQGSKALK